MIRRTYFILVIFHFVSFVASAETSSRASHSSGASGQRKTNPPRDFSAKAKDAILALSNHHPYLDFLDKKLAGFGQARTTEENTGVAKYANGQPFHSQNDMEGNPRTTKSLIEKWVTQKMTPSQLALTLAVLEAGGKSAFGEYDPFLCQMSESYSIQDAKSQRQLGHAWFDTHNARIRSHAEFQQAGTSIYAAENEAESWPHLGDDLMNHARNCVKSWLYSPGHKMAMMNFRTRFCYSMSLGTNGTAYCIGEYQDNLPRGARRP